MIVNPAAAYLVEFGSDLPSTPARSDHEGNAAGAISNDHTGQIEEAYARGFREGVASAEADLEMRLINARAAFDKELAAFRQNWAANEAQALARQLLRGLNQIETNIADAATKILKPFLSSAVQHSVVEELRKLLISLMSEGEGLTIQVSGPEDLLGELRKSINGEAHSVSYTVSDRCDVRIALDQTRLETSLNEWLRRINEAVG